MEMDRNDLMDVVEAIFLPAVASLGFAVVDEETSSSFDNATVTLQADPLRLRIVRERSQVFVDFGSVVAPTTWFDSAVVLDYLELGKEGGFHQKDAERTTRALARLIHSVWGELVSKFSAQSFPETERALTILRNRRAAERLGF